MIILPYILIAIIAAGIGFFFGKKSVKFDGLFVIDDSDETTTRWTLDIRADPESIPNKKEIRLKVGKLSDEVV